MKIIHLMCVLVVVLFTLPTNAQESGLSIDGKQKWKIAYHPKLPASDYDIGGLRTEIANMIKKCYQVYDSKKQVQEKPADAGVFEEEIDIVYNRRKNMVFDNVILKFSDLFDRRIYVNKFEALDQRIMLNPYAIEIAGIALFTYEEKDFESAKRLADYLFYLQYQYGENIFKPRLAAFEPVAAQYRALKVKPPVSEEQRRFIVQANSLSQKKEYENAIALYVKALLLDPTAYPVGYSNLALLSAQLSKFQIAIYYMKKYLMLEPESPDARGAQDKIYEWEIAIGK